MLQEKLKQHTAAEHSQLEEQMYVDRIMQRTLTVPMYHTLLATNYLAHQRYEKLIFGALDAHIVEKLDVPSRAKLSALESDVEYEGIDKKSLLEDFASTAPELKDSMFALGMMYVLEGATLGGSMIVKQLKLNPHFSADHHFSYYGCYGSELIAKWQQFLAVLNEVPEDQHQSVLEGASFLFKEIAAIAKAVEGYDLSNKTITDS